MVSCAVIMLAPAVAASKILLQTLQTPREDYHRSDCLILYSLIHAARQFYSYGIIRRQLRDYEARLISTSVHTTMSRLVQKTAQW